MVLLSAREDERMGEVVTMRLSNNEAQEFAHLRFVRAIFGCELRPDLERRYLYLAQRFLVAGRAG